MKLKSSRTLRLASVRMTEAHSETKGLVEGVIEAIKDQQSALEVRLEGLTLSLPGTHMAVQLSGTLTVSVHMRELTPEEKEAYASANVAHLRQ